MRKEKEARAISVKAPLGSGFLAGRSRSTHATSVPASENLQASRKTKIQICGKDQAATLVGALHCKDWLADLRSADDEDSDKSYSSDTSLSSNETPRNEAE